MSFLDKINAAKNPVAQAEKKNNPLIKTAPVTPIATATAPVIAAVAAHTPTTKTNPLLVNKLTPTTGSVESEPKKNPVFPFKKTILPAVETKAEASEAPTQESKRIISDATPTDVKIDTVPALIEDTDVKTPVAEIVINESSDVKETKTSAKRTSSRNTKKTAPSVDKSEEVSISSSAKTDEEAYPTTTISFMDASTELTSPFEDDKWNTFKNKIEEEIDAIIINQDMNPGVLKVTLSELNIVYDEIAQPLHETKSLLDNLTNKEDGTIAVIKSISLGSGNNDMERKKAGFLAAMNYKPKFSEGNINLFEVAAEVRSRYNFLKSVYDRLKYKSDMLITMNGALKLESELIRRGDN